MRSDVTGEPISGAWNLGSHGVSPSTASTPSLVSFLPPSLPFRDSQHPGSHLPFSVLSPGQWLGHVSRTNPPVPPCCPLPMVRDRMQAQAGWGWGNIALCHLQGGWKHTSSLDWWGHSVCLNLLPMQTQAPRMGLSFCSGVGWWAEGKWKSKVKLLVPQSCPTLCNSMDCSPPQSGRSPGEGNG